MRCCEQGCASGAAIAIEAFRFDADATEAAV